LKIIKEKSVLGKFILFVSVAAAMFVFSGCTASPNVKTKFQRNYAYNYERSNNPTQFRYQPVIGTHQPDTKTMIDMGEWAKIWVKNYRNENKTFVASHSIITMVREPGFISGEDIPRRRRDTVYNTYGGRTFTYRSSDLMYGNSSQGSQGLTDGEIKNYVNDYEYSKKTKKLPPQKRADVLKYDREIKEYIAKTRAAAAKKAEMARAKEKERAKREKARRAADKGDPMPEYETEEEYKNGSLK
jgi:hypothetical protein